MSSLSRTFTNHRTAGEGAEHFMNSPLPLPPASQTLRHQPGNYCRELTSAHSQQPDSNREPLVSEHKLLTTKLRALKGYKMGTYGRNGLINFKIFFLIRNLKRKPSIITITIIIVLTSITSTVTTVTNFYFIIITLYSDSSITRLSTVIITSRS